ncbi:ferredoxin, partial [Chromobacterium piscinae]
MPDHADWADVKDKL